jgi:hypothetical protein
MILKSDQMRKYAMPNVQNKIQYPYELILESLELHATFWAHKILLMLYRCLNITVILVMWTLSRRGLSNGEHLVFLAFSCI